MDSVVDISWIKLALFSLILLIPLAINYRYKLGIAKDTTISVLRMTVQLILIGVYLEYLFHLNSLLINVLWIAVMIVVGASTIAGKAHLPKKPLMLPLITGLVCGLCPLLIAMTVGLVQPTPLYSAQYMIPLAGMLLGNSLSSNIIALQNLFTAFEERKTEYEAAISLGASPKYASFPFVQDALKKIHGPNLSINDRNWPCHASRDDDRADLRRSKPSGRDKVSIGDHVSDFRHVKYICGYHPRNDIEQRANQRRPN